MKGPRSEMLLLEIMTEGSYFAEAKSRAWCDDDDDDDDVVMLV